jgi:N-methylhydantoinase B
VFFDQDDGRHTPRFGTKLPSVKIKRGHRVRIESPGGGGYGPPRERAFAAIAQDIKFELVSRVAAERDYGVVVAADGSVRRRGK